MIYFDHTFMVRHIFLINRSSLLFQNIFSFMVFSNITIMIEPLMMDYSEVVINFFIVIIFLLMNSWINSKALMRPIILRTMLLILVIRIYLSRMIKFYVFLSRYSNSILYIMDF